MLPALKIMRSDDREDIDGAVRLGLRLHGVVFRQRLLLALLTTILSDLTHRTGSVGEGFRDSRSDGALRRVLNRHLRPSDDLQEVPRKTGRSQPRHEGEPGERLVETTEHAGGLAAKTERLQIKSTPALGS